SALSPEKLATTIARLASLLGEDRIGMPMPVDGHLPEAFAIGEYAPSPPPVLRQLPRKSRSLLSTRVFRPPVPVEVIMSEEKGQTHITSIQGDVSGRVRLSSGPWHIESSWWTDAPDAREYWNVELERGGLYRVYQSATSTEWFVDARYD